MQRGGGGVIGREGGKDGRKDRQTDRPTDRQARLIDTITKDIYRQTHKHRCIDR